MTGKDVGQDIVLARLDFLDALRAISALLVMLWHFTNGNNVFKLNEPSLLVLIGSIGWVGVDIFFRVKSHSCHLIG